MSFPAFRVRSFRFQWPADLLVSWAFEMETLILGWYVMVQTGSVLVLTAFASLHYLGTLAAPMFGVLGDRLGSRGMLCAMRAGYAVLALALAALALAGLLTPAVVLVVAGLGGIFRPNDQLMRTALIGDTIPREHVAAALGISRTTLDSARVAGALAGATLSTTLGIGPAYVFVTVFYLASFALTLGVARGRPADAPGPGVVAATPPSHWRELLDGLAHVRATPRVLAAVWLALLVNLTAYPVTNGLLPYVAREVYATDAAGLGLLAASFSFGALLGSIAMAATGGSRHPDRAMIVSSLVWYVFLLAFARAETLSVGAPLLALAGLAQSVAIVAMFAALLAAADHRFRARVMGVRMLAVYGLPVGLMTAGALIERIGFAATLTGYGALGLALTGAIALRWRASVWRP